MRVSALAYSPYENFTDLPLVDFMISTDARIYYPEHIWSNPFPLKASASVSIQPGERLLISTGLFFAIPLGYAGFVTIAPELAGQGLLCVNAPGLIDCQYRGEIKVIMQNCDSDDSLTIDRGIQLGVMAIRPTASLEMEHLT
jgi:dUTP pyrophosphatase